MTIFKRSPWISFFNAGGCIPGDTMMILENGDIMTAAEMIDGELEGDRFESMAKGQILARACEAQTITWDGFSQKRGKIIAAYKLPSEGRLIEVQTFTARLKLTPDHKVLVDSKGGPVWKKAKNLEKNDHLYSPRKIPIKGKDLPTLQDCLPKGTPTNPKRDIQTKNEESCWNRSMAGSEICGKEVDDDLLYLLGLIAPEMHTSDQKEKKLAIRFRKEEKNLTEEILMISKKWAIESEIMEDETGISIIFQLNNDPLSFFSTYFKLRHKNKKRFQMAFKLPERLVRSFLTGFFDRNGLIRKENPKGLGIMINDYDGARMIQLLLKRLGLVSRIVMGGRDECEISIATKQDILETISTFPVRHPVMKTGFAELKNYLENHDQRTERICSAPLLCGKLIKEAIKKHPEGLDGLSSIIDRIKSGKRIGKKTIGEACKEIEKRTGSTGELGKIRELISDESYLDPVIDIRFIKDNEDFVYNFNVEHTHKYIPEGAFVVSNCNGCTLEIFACFNPRYDVTRFGMELESSAKHADVLIVSGIVNKQNVKRLKRVYDQLPEPKKVVAVGACAISNGLYKGSYSSAGPVDKVIPVDVYVPGCPPRPESIIDGIIRCLDDKDNRKNNEA